MTDPTSSQSIACEEVFDDISQPSVEEIKDYATKIGIDPDSEPQLLPLAVEGLMKPLPPGWKPFLNEKQNCYYYFNQETKKSQWEHPLDKVYRELVVKARTESQSLSLGEPTEDATYTREDLPSYEEPPPTLQLSIHKKDVKLSPLRFKPKLGEIGTRFSDVGIKSHSKNEPKLFRQKSEERPSKKIGLSLFESVGENNGFKKKDIEKGKLTLNGGGSMFLKSNSKKNETASTPVADGDNLKNVKEKKTWNKNSIVDDNESIEENVQEIKSKMKIEEDNNDVKITSNLKVIKPDPTDFVKPELTPRNDEGTIKAISPESEEEKESSSEEPLRLGKKEEMEIRDMLSKAENIFKEESRKRKEEMKNLFELERETELKKYKEELLQNQKLEMERILVEEKLKYEEKIRKELETLRKEMENRSAGALNEEKAKLEKKFEKQKRDFEESYKIKEEELKRNYAEKFDLAKKKLEEEQKSKMANIEKDLAKDLEESKKKLMASQTETLNQIRQKYSKEINNFEKDFVKKKNEQDKNVSFKENLRKGEDEKYESLLKEKKSLEDKYRCLKEKYSKLKADVKLSIEKRNRRREQSLTTTTGSETEKSPSVRKSSSPSFHRKNSPKHIRPNSNLDVVSKKSNKIIDQKNRQSSVIKDFDNSTSDKSLKSDEGKHGTKSTNPKDECDSSDEEIIVQPERASRKKLFSKPPKNSSKHRDRSRSCSPVENLRKQLEKLEDLEDQFPQNAQGDTYHLRYPFSDGQKFEGSSELEFFRHRIHLERDSIRRAKESLRLQKSQFKQKQNELKHKHGATSKQTLQKLCLEEKELTDMEVSLHRTRSLLGEKIIRLRHLEQSLQRASSLPHNNNNNNNNHKQEDATLSDLSSHSASSGISSTEFLGGESPLVQPTKNSHLKESSEIIQSLENLNSEIREIWEVLNKQQQISSIATVMTPLPLVYPDLGWAGLFSGTAAHPVPPSITTLADRLQNYRQHVALANAQSTMVTHDMTQGATTTLVEKTRNLRQWLRQNSSADPSLETVASHHHHQATL